MWRYVCAGEADLGSFMVADPLSSWGEELACVCVGVGVGVDVGVVGCVAGECGICGTPSAIKMR